MSLSEPTLPVDKVIVYFDFDNTISDSDILDSVIAQFATGTAWAEAEKLWEEGRIGARDCLDLQMRSLRVTPEALFSFLAPIRLDPTFFLILEWLRANRIEHSILSDNFTPIIAKILTNNQIEGLPIYANSLRFADGGIIPSFPFFDETCPRCAHCKKIHFLERPDAYTIYVGDGRSDICPAQIADRVYAKSFLLNHLAELGQAAVPFTQLSEVFFDLKMWWAQLGKPTPMPAARQLV